jgi:hypothetical protein
MFWPTKRATPQSFGSSTVMLDSFVKKENIVIRKFVVSPSVVSIDWKIEDLKSQPATYFKPNKPAKIINQQSILSGFERRSYGAIDSAHVLARPWSAERC